MKIYDLRSDTVTRPSDEMRNAMYSAEVGDDVYSEDPSINRLQELASELTGKSDSLFVPSGCMANLIAIYLNCGRGNEVITHKDSHIVHYELGSAAAIAGSTIAPVAAERGILSPEAVAPYIRTDPSHNPKTAMIEIENTHNREGGTCYKIEELKSLYEFAKKNSLSLHIDGARVFNAAAATGVSVKEITSFCDTVTFCLSKGLGAPVGSVLCGSSSFIEDARHVRKLLGGGMRQAGIIAAAGIYALENNVDRLQTDHKNARTIAQALSETEWADIDPQSVETNIICFRTPSKPASSVVSSFKKQGVLCSSMGSDLVRIVTHLDVSEEDTERVCKIIRDLKV